KPNVGVVTAIGEIPVHVEYFSDPEELAEEKSKLVQALDTTDFAVLNHDDPAVLEMRNITKGKVLTFGFMEGAEIKVSDFDFKVGAMGEPEGVVFKIHHGGMADWLEIKINGSLGKSQAWSASAAVVVGLIFGLNLVKISGALSAYRGPAGRLKILKGIKNSFLIDDTYNASPSSTHLALETLKALPAKRKIAVLGDMLELGKYAIQAHRDAGNFAGTFANILVTVGSRAKFIADSAANQLSRENIFSFDTSLEAGQKVRELVQEGDLVLVKGSQGIRMEKVVEEIMAEPGKKKELLVRQSKKWLEK
ncbi:MAG: cyanophycin synthetase, partial [bacterium]|nr:cyanophycin synthetase [bacterium]